MVRRAIGGSIVAPAGRDDTPRVSECKDLVRLAVQPLRRPGRPAVLCRSCRYHWKKRRPRMAGATEVLVDASWQLESAG